VVQSGRAPEGQCAFASGIGQLPITTEHAIAAGDLPRHHDDPFDRMLVAQAIAESLTIISNDSRLRLYAGTLIEPWPGR